VRFAGSRPRLGVGPRGWRDLAENGRTNAFKSTPAAAGANSTGPMGEQSLRTIGSRTEFEDDRMRVVVQKVLRIYPRWTKVVEPLQTLVNVYKKRSHALLDFYELLGWVAEGVHSSLPLTRWISDRHPSPRPLVFSSGSLPLSYSWTCQSKVQRSSPQTQQRQLQKGLSSERPSEDL
jgi:hypothetical protein